jgi:drug/metabolite transporter (DMT)-like permease
VRGAHPHLLVNHLPLIATAIGIVLLVFAWENRAERGRLASAVLVLVLAGLGSGVAYLTGVSAADAVENQPNFEEEAIHRHHEPALFALIASGVTSLLAVGVAVASRRREGPLPGAWFGWLIVAALASAVLLGWTSEVGGVIRHLEIR